ncbi:hypothetical protein MDA_GLEAN10003174 [Myotis davidii]|uniref:Uncharacterized protein n=1 Tax=Myotis davidii TaxID=225400 RepID=L5M5N8_MYODS|nr:hypothetical protein MDA_GLEAN10003174 [Myotis davidii]
MQLPPPGPGCSSLPLFVSLENYWTSATPCPDPPLSRRRSPALPVATPPRCVSVFPGHAPPLLPGTRAAPAPGPHKRLCGRNLRSRWDRFILSLSPRASSVSADTHFLRGLGRTPANLDCVLSPAIPQIPVTNWSVHSPANCQPCICPETYAVTLPPSTTFQQQTTTAFGDKEQPRRCLSRLHLLGR